MRKQQQKKKPFDTNSRYHPADLGGTNLLATVQPRTQPIIK